MTRFAAGMDVHFWEEPVVSAAVDEPRLQAQLVAPHLLRLVPLLPPELAEAERDHALRRLLDGHLAGRPQPRVRWYYTPMLLPFSRHVAADCTVYDCMDELANFRFAPAELAELERELFAAADLVFTGGISLFEAKRRLHPRVFAFPSAVDRRHFAQARELPRRDPAAPPLLGFAGVIDERFDTALLAELADARPDWQFDIVGPVVKIAPEYLPPRANIRYPGRCDYAELPAVLAGWDVALMPFAINESTRFISPTKTPEYLAAGKPVVATPIRDVERHYGGTTGVWLGRTPDQFAACCDQALALARGDGGWLDEVDRLLAAMSWDSTHRDMAELIASVGSDSVAAAAVAAR